jgi:hypothetical protein
VSPGTKRWEDTSTHGAETARVAEIRVHDRVEWVNGEVDAAETHGNVDLGVTGQTPGFVICVERCSWDKAIERIGHVTRKDELHDIMLGQ